MPFLQTYLCGRGHETEHLHMGPRSTAPDKLLCLQCLKNSIEDIEIGLLPKDIVADWFSQDLRDDEELRMRISKVMCEMPIGDIVGLPSKILDAAVARELMYGITLQTIRLWRVRYRSQEMLFCHNSIAFPTISTSAAPITINRHNGDYAQREKERLTKRSKEHNRKKTSREEADANTARVVGEDTANVLFAKGLHA